MRADRLITLLMILQARGRQTAHDLAKELEVSERTIYRDVEALSISGAPIYAERGPGGGISLLEDYRTNLTGLSPQEVRALFMLNIPAALNELGVGQELRTALLKLSASLPATSRQEEAQARQRILLDPTDDHEAQPSSPHLPLIQQALWQNRILHFVEELNFGALTTREVEPYGLVASSDVWHLVWMGNGRIDTTRVSQIRQAQIGDESFVRPPDFDLTAFWDERRRRLAAGHPGYAVTLRVSPQFLNHLPYIVDPAMLNQIESISARDEHDWQEIKLTFDSLEQARDKILGFGTAVEVIAPLPLRLSVCDYAQQIVGVYNR